MTSLLASVIGGVFGAAKQAQQQNRLAEQYYSQLSGVNLWPNAYFGLSGLGAQYGVRSIASTMQRGRTCRYCGNLYQLETIKDMHNCPTCAGSWE